MDILEKWSYHQGTHLPWGISLLFPIPDCLCGQDQWETRSADPLGLSWGRCWAPSSLARAPGQGDLLVEPGGFHVLHVVVLDLAEDPDPLFSPLDFQRGRREDWEAEEKSGSPLRSSGWHILGPLACPCS